MSDAPKKILIIEDEQLLRNLLKQRLEKEGFTILTAKDGEEGLEIFKNNTLDLVLLDIILPKLSGFEFMEKVISDPFLTTKKIPIVVISNLGQEKDIEKGQILGAMGYFIKAQLSIEDLVGRVKDFFC